MNPPHPPPSPLYKPTSTTFLNLILLELLGFEKSLLKIEKSLLKLLFSQLK